MSDASLEPGSRTDAVASESAVVLPVAVVGGGRSSRFYRECLTLDSRFDVAWSADDVPADADLNSLAAVFLFDASEKRGDSIRQCLSAGCRVITVSPIAGADSADDDLSSLVGLNKAISDVRILRRGFEDPDYRRACQVVADGEAGDVLHVEFVFNQMAAFFLPEDPETPDLCDQQAAAELEFGVLAAIAPDLLAQLLTLIPRPVVRLFATLSFRRPEFGPVGSLSGRSRLAARPAEVDSGFRVWLEFETGETAQLSVDLASHADIATGWTLQTIRGGYRNSRQVLTESDGEIYDVPVEPGSESLLDAVARFLEASATEGESASTCDGIGRLFSLQTESRVLKLLEAVRDSATKRQTVECRI